MLTIIDRLTPKIVTALAIGGFLIVACGGSSPTLTSPAASLDLASYNLQIQVITTRINAELTEVFDILDFGAFDNKLWQESVSESGETLVNLAVEAESLRPPNDLVDFHESWLMSIRHYGNIGMLVKTLSTSFDSEDSATAVLEDIAKEKGLGDANMEFAESVFDKTNR